MHKQISVAMPLLAFSPIRVYDIARNVLALKQRCYYCSTMASDDAEKIGWWFVRTKTTDKTRFSL
jgi:hypothetical protein